MIVSIVVFLILYIWIGIIQPINQIKRASFKEKRKWVKSLKDKNI